MIDIPMRSKGAIDYSTIQTLNNSRKTANAGTPPAAAGIPAAPPRAALQRQMPPLCYPVQKGQKVPLKASSQIHAIKACFGWKAKNPQCDADVSAFLLGANGKVPGDSWFVFYGQTESPDRSTAFSAGHAEDLEIITVDFDRLNPSVQKIVFVLTINEAFEKNLNFGMMADAYIRILDQSDQAELASFCLSDYYANVISMMIGEVYKHNGVWKFNAVGNGVARDLAGLCALYGVEVND